MFSGLVWLLAVLGNLYASFSPLEFTAPPYQIKKPHPSQFNADQQQLIAREITDLCKKGAVTEVSTPPRGGFFSTLFLVPKKDGGQRPVINLKNLNSFVEVPHFKMEGIHTLRSLVAEKDWLVKIDLKDAYFSVPICQEHKKFLCFQVGDKLYHFNCLPFGLTSAPWVFTKTLKPVVALGRELGMRLVVYIDDILLMAESEEKARDQAAGMTYLLECLGFTINTEKTVTVPTQTLDFLGFTVNTVTMELTLPPGKIKKIRAESRKLLEAELVSARALSRLIGKMSAASQVIPPAPLFYRHLQMEMTVALRRSDQDYEASLQLSPESREELTWWDTRMINWNGKTIISFEPDLVIESDASKQGWGASCQDTSTGGPWTLEEKSWHINCLELLAATLALKTFTKKRTRLSVLLKIDNTTAVAYINNHGGTVSKQLVTLSRELWMWCLERNIHIQAQYLPGAMNLTADRESRCMRDRSDWKLDHQTFGRINERYGPLEVDMFASRLTNQCRRYFSWRPDPFAEGTDAFLQTWSDFKGFANPPWNLIPRVLKKVQSQEADVTLVAPVWKTQPWYALLITMLVDWPRQPHPVVSGNSPSGKASRAKAFRANRHGVTLKNQQVLQLRWDRWCSERGSDGRRQLPIEGPESGLLEDRSWDRGQLQPKSEL